MNQLKKYIIIITKINNIYIYIYICMYMYIYIYIYITYVIIIYIASAYYLSLELVIMEINILNTLYQFMYQSEPHNDDK